MSKMIGKRYGKLVVLSRLSSKKNRVLCRCDCGRNVDVCGPNLTQGKKTHCGCVKYADRDITGKRFGRWTAIGRHNDSVEHWMCRCDCGNESVVSRSNLLNEYSQSCGCLQKERVANTGKNNWIDLTGQRFGKLVTLESVLDEKGYRKKWKCRCDCGNEKIIASACLQNGSTKSCGCLIRETARKNLIDISGQRFGRLVALKPVENSDGHRDRWLCKCDCGREKEIRSISLKKGTSNSCGCLQKKLAGRRVRERNLVDIAGQRFGRLVAIKPVEDKRGHLNKWLCRCDCGKEKAITTMSLKRGATRSCGCLAREVAGARRITDNIDSNGVKHSRDRRLDPSNTYWADAVLDRDGHRCQACLAKGMVVAHHKNAWASFPEQRFDIGNGVTTCEECHGRFHSIYGKGKNTEGQWVDFVASSFKTDGNVWKPRRKYAVAVGEKYGRLTVLEKVKSRNGGTRWRCRCDCGKEKIMKGSPLKCGRVKSCGCLCSDVLRAMAKKKRRNHHLH